MAKTRHEIKVPSLSATMTEGVLVSWEKDLGEEVERGDVVATLETDKAIMDIEVFQAGFLSGPLASVGATVQVGAAIAFIVASAEEVEGGELELDESPGASTPSEVQILEATPTNPAMPNVPATVLSGRPAPASPYARKLASELGVDLARVSGTGPGGVKQAADIQAAHAAQAGFASTPGAPLPASAPLDIPGTLRAMSPIEAATAEAMSQSLAMPTFRVTVRASLAPLQRAAKTSGVSTTVAIARACAEAIQKHPKLNSAWAGPGRIAERSQVDVGIAVAADGGLVVPVLRAVEARAMKVLAEDWKDLVGRARNRRLTPADWEHPTFTISNMGMLGVDHFDAIPTVGTGAILAISAADADGRAPLCLTSDHRVINGADSAAFLSTLRELMEHPGSWLAPAGPAIPEGDWDYDVVVVGGGPGGEDCARDLAQHGLRVAMVNDSPLPGGECLWRGCIPSKAWRVAADRIRDRADDARLGVRETDCPVLDWSQLESERRTILEERGKLALQTDKALKVTFIHGHGSFRGPHELEIDPSGNSKDPHRRSGPGTGKKAETVTFGCAVVATGAPPFVPPIPGAREAVAAGHALTSDTVWHLEQLPTRLVIVGAGAIGAEMAQMLHDFGCEVLLLEAQDRILAEVEDEVARQLAAAMSEDERLTVATGASVTRISGSAGDMTVEWTDASGAAQTSECERVLMATGKRPQTGALDLESAGVALDERGAIAVDARGRTSTAHIFAVGDVIGGLMLAHTAGQQGRIAAATILGEDWTYDEARDCGVIFTRPQAAFVGLSAASAKERGLEVSEVKAPLKIDAQARIHGEEHGLIKLVVDNASHRIVGVHLLADHAAELVGEAVLMVSCDLTLEQVARAIHPHPTTTEMFGDLARRLLARLRKAEERKRRSRAKQRATAGA